MNQEVKEITDELDEVLTDYYEEVTDLEGAMRELLQVLPRLKQARDMYFKLSE
jgi:hypothetical protein